VGGFLGYMVMGNTGAVGVPFRCARTFHSSTRWDSSDIFV
jgi:hypothetical protein